MEHADEPDVTITIRVHSDSSVELRYDGERLTTVSGTDRAMEVAGQVLKAHGGDTEAAVALYRAGIYPPVLAVDDTPMPLRRVVS